MAGASKTKTKQDSRTAATAAVATDNGPACLDLRRETWQTDASRSQALDRLEEGRRRRWRREERRESSLS